MIAGMHHEVTLDTIRDLEALFALSWPAEHRHQHHGWLFRSTLGITRRANSVMALADPVVPVVDAIAAAERFYRDLNRPCVFHIAPAAVPEHLDETLASLGYSITGTSEVMVTGTHPHGPQVPQAPEMKVVLLPSASRKWTDVYTHNTRSERHVRHGIVNRIQVRRAFGLCFFGNEPAGCGLATVYEEWCAVGCMVTMPNFRRRGVGSAILHKLREWAAQQGALGLALQVDGDNKAAQQLYAQRGFTSIYPYHYRRRDLDDAG